MSLIASTSFGFKSSKASTYFFPCFSIVFICFSKAFPKADKVNLACSIIYFWLYGNISSPVRYSYLSTLSDDKADILAASLLILYCSFPSLISSSIVILSYIYFKRFYLNFKGLYDASVASLIKKQYGFTV